MSSRRKKLNILLIIIAIILGGWAAWLYRRPPLVLSPRLSETTQPVTSVDTLTAQPGDKPVEDKDSVKENPSSEQGVSDMAYASSMEAEGRSSDRETSGKAHKLGSMRFSDADPKSMIKAHPFSKEALKVLNGGLAEDDSLSRRRILSYCEHLRTSYTTRDIDFIRQVFSDNALIIVGHVVKTGSESAGGALGNEKVKYSVRTKREYLDKLNKIFASGKEIDVKFSDFRIMRHPTLEGIYGVTLRQAYKSGAYQDDGYLFLLWDFRNKSMPQIHVRTWQPARSLAGGEDDLIDISDFNLE